MENKYVASMPRKKSAQRGRKSNGTVLWLSRLCMLPLEYYDTEELQLHQAKHVPKQLDAMFDVRHDLEVPIPEVACQIGLSLGIRAMSAF